MSKTPDTSAAVKAVEKEKEAEKKKVEPKKENANEPQPDTEGTTKPAVAEVTANAETVSPTRSGAETETAAIEPSAVKENATSNDEGKSSELPIREKNEEVALETDAKDAAVAPPTETEGAKEESTPASIETAEPAESENKTEHKVDVPETTEAAEINTVKTEDAIEKPEQTKDTEEQQKQQPKQELAN